MMKEFAEIHLENFFSPLEISRGKELMDKKRVQNVVLKTNPSQKILTATVEGKHKQEYHVKITHVNKGGAIGTQCTCITRYFCSHAAALLLAVAKSHQKKLAKAQAKQISEHVSLPAWVYQLPPKEKKLLDPKNYQLYFILDEIEYQQRVVLQVRAEIRRLNTSGKATGKPFSAQSKDTPILLSVEQLACFATLEFLAEEHRPEEGTYVLTKPLNIDFFAKFINEQLVYWQQKQDRSLHFSEPVVVNFNWRWQDNGRQILYPELLPAKCRLLPASPIMYINEQNQHIGLVKHNLQPTISGNFCKHAQLEPEEAKLFNEFISQQIKNVGFFPKAQTFTEKQTRNEPPTPCLVIKQQVIDFYKAWYDTELVHQPTTLAFFQLQYGEQRYNIHSESDSFLQLFDQVLVSFQRDVDQEHQYLQYLKKYLSIEPLVDIDNVANSTFSNEKLEHAFFVAFQADYQQLIQFKSEVKTFLEPKGWIVEFELAEDTETLLEYQHWYTDIVNESHDDKYEFAMGIVVDEQRVNLLPYLIDLFKHETLPTNSAQEVVIHLPGMGLVAIPTQRIEKIKQFLTQLVQQSKLTDNYHLLLKLHQGHLVHALQTSFEGADLQNFGQQQLAKIGERLHDFSKIDTIPVPKTMDVELRWYQREGLNWLQFLTQYGFNGILADEMGLGKTVQALAYICYVREQSSAEKPCLVVAPTSVILNWQREAAKFCKTLKTLLWHGEKRQQFVAKIPHVDLLLTSYPILLRDAALLTEQQYHVVILDEAQTIKNPQAKISQMVCQLHAQQRLCLTGTPIENHLGELWSLFHFLMPDFLSTQKQFNQRYRYPIEKNHDQTVQAELYNRLKPFILRRTKQIVARELPQKTEIVQTMELAAEQSDLYEAVRLAMNEKIQSAIAEKGIEGSQLIILDAILKLRQVCCHPQLLKIPEAKVINESVKLETLTTMLTELVEDGRKILVFSQFTSMLAIIEKQLVARQLKFVKLTGQTKNRTTAVDRFQEGGVPIFLISLKAGGTGLNLTAADTVIHFEPWWNPAVEQQATDRAHRIGQDKPVFVYKFIVANTIEEKILTLQANKKALSERLLESSSASTKISREDLVFLLGD